MSTKVTAQVGGGQARVHDRRADERSQARDLWLDDLKRAMADTGWTVDGLAAHFQIHRSYVGRMLDGDKPFTNDRIVDLPDDLEARFEHLRAERFGLIVVRPLTGLEAQKALVAGLIGLMSAPQPTVQQLPDKTAGTAKADIRVRAVVNS